ARHPPGEALAILGFLARPGKAIWGESAPHDPAKRRTGPNRIARERWPWRLWREGTRGQTPNRRRFRTTTLQSPVQCYRRITRGTFSPIGITFRWVSGPGGRLPGDSQQGRRGGSLDLGRGGEALNATQRAALEGALVIVHQCVQGMPQRTDTPGLL